MAQWPKPSAQLYSLLLPLCSSQPRRYRESAAKALQDVDKKSTPAKAAASKGDAKGDEEMALLPQGSGSPPR